MKGGSAPPGGRRYTVSAKVLEANRRNLVKARAADPALRFRATPRRLEACRRNLLKAQEARRRSPAYAVPFIHGLYCVSLLRSLALAGEKSRGPTKQVRATLASKAAGQGLGGGVMLSSTTWGQRMWGTTSRYEQSGEVI